MNELLGQKFFMESISNELDYIPVVSSTLSWDTVTGKLILDDDLLVPESKQGAYRFEQTIPGVVNKLQQRIDFIPNTVYSLQVILKPQINGKVAMGFGSALGDNIISYDEKTKETIIGSFFISGGSKEISSGWVYLWGTVNSNHFRFQSDADWFTIWSNILSSEIGSYCYIYKSQIEKKPFTTSFIDGTRGAGKLIYPNPIPGASNFTVSFWLYLNNKPSSNPQYEAVCTLNSGMDKNGLYIDYDNNTTLRFFTYNSAGTAQVASTPATLRFGWTHITVTRSNSFLYGYVNGELKCQVANSGTLNLEGSLEFGNRNTIPANYANILMDELRIDKVVRSDKEIMAWYLSDSPFFPRGNERIIE